jgi:SAM-dependent methyltransferase
VTGRAVANQRESWPKTFDPLTPEQERIRDDFMMRWLEVLPQRYGAIERFNHEYPVRAWARHGRPPAAGRARTLEIGAGLGAHIGYEDLSQQDYHALEMRPNVLDVLRQRYPAVEAVLGNIEESTPFPDGYFHRIVVVHVLEHLCNLPAALVEIDRLMAPAGLLSVVAPCEGSLAYSLARRVSAKRIFEKMYRTPYRWFIEREHVNTYHEVRTELARRFHIIDERRWPLRSLPLAMNLVVGLTMVRRRADAAT